MPRSRFGSSIGRQLFLSLCLVSIVPLSSVVALVSHEYAGELRKRTEEYARMALGKAAGEISAYASNLDRLLYQFQLSDELQAAMRNPGAKSFKRRLDDRDAVRRAVLAMKSLDADIDGVYVRSSDGALFSANDADGSDPRLFTYRLEAEPWFAAVASGAERRLVLPIAANARGAGFVANEYVFGYARTIIDLDTGSPLGIVVMDVKRRAVDRFVTGLAPEARGRFSLRSGEGAEFYSAGSIAGEVKARDILVLDSALPGLGWTASLALAVPQLTAGARELALRAFAAVVVTAATFMLLSSFVSRRVGARFARLADTMSRIASGDFRASAGIEGGDEIACLARDLEDMGRTLAELWADLDASHRREKELEFKALQAQINPHFVFNTLETANMRAVMAGDYGTSDLLSAFGRILRFAFDFRSALVPLKSELAYLRDYLDIEAMRRSGSFSVLYEVEDAALCLAVPRLILQPLAENALQHGLAPSGYRGTIRVRARAVDGVLHLEISDDGAGMDDVRLEGLRRGLSERRSLESGSGIGVSNVHDRIVSLWGEGWGLSVDSSPGGGCAWRIALPASAHSGEAAR